MQNLAAEARRLTRETTSLEITNETTSKSARSHDVVVLGINDWRLIIAVVTDATGSDFHFQSPWYHV